MTEVLISLGSNIEKEVNLPAAIALLRQHPDILVLAVSPLLESGAIAADGGRAAQPAYHNAAVRAETTLTPEELRAALRDIEARLGRVRSADKFAPRTIDLDLSFYGSVIAADGSVAAADGKPLPDPDVLRFAHVAIPLAAVAGEWVHPATGETLAAIAAGYQAQVASGA
jgi:2-amino-4-hydroxy-6-hydroxymethyldihydropteridine diphosphokinase